MGFQTQVVLQWVAVALYGAAALLLGSAVIFGGARRGRWGHALAAVGLLPHGAAIVLRWIEVGHGPYLQRYEVLTSLAWVAVAFLVAFLARNPRWTALAIFVLPVGILLVGAAVFADPQARDIPPTLRSTWLVFHITFAKFAVGAFLLSVASAALLLAELRPGPGTWRERVPEPAALDAYVVRFIGYGFAFWTVTIAAGAIWAEQSWGRYWGWDPIETSALVGWLVYGSLLHARLFLRLAPRATAWLAIAAAGLFAALFALPFLIPSLHGQYFQ